MNDVTFIQPEREIEVDLPVQPVGWRILIRPYEAATHTSSGIELPQEALESEEYLTYVGQIVAMGDQCYKAVTRSGIELANMDPKPKIGDWIMFGTYGGQKVVTKTGTKYLMMNDDSIMGIGKDPASVRAYI